MNNLFSLSDDVLKIHFSNLKSRSDICNILEIREKDLIYYLYRMDPLKKYKTFDIKKRNGNFRTISAPFYSLKLIQKKLYYLINLSYNPRNCIQGFIQNRSIITNAEKHLNSKYILNIDIHDFFGSINFGRIRGIFLHKPFNFNTEVSTILGQICCYDNKLPQCAPTSPIISNLICTRLDTKLMHFAHKYNLFYTRYADDITFSSKKRFKKNIIRFQGGDYSKPILSKELINIFEANGFTINNSKVRFSSKDHRQEVTGLVINEKINTTQKYIRQLRAMLHAWSKYGLENAGNDYYFRYCKRYLGDNPDIFPSFINIVYGKLVFLSMVRGYQDKVFRKYYNEFINLTKTGKFLPINIIDILDEFTYIIEVENSAEQGTIFFTDTFGWITNYHVIKNASDDIYVYPTSMSPKYKAKVIKEFPDKDLAFLEVNGLKPDNFLSVNLDYNFSIDCTVTVCGYPNHNEFDSLYKNSGKIVSSRIKNRINYFVFDKPIILGNSGGPVLNKDDEIVGIASTGSTFQDSSDEMFYGIIPIKTLIDI